MDKLDDYARLLNRYCHLLRKHYGKNFIKTSGFGNFNGKPNQMYSVRNGGEVMGGRGS